MIDAGGTSVPGRLALTKHHGAGNDFLVLLDADGKRPVRAGEVVALCDRHRGIGADGLLRATRRPGEKASLTMELYNADGSVAEMSGNGIRCLVQAAVDARWVQAGAVEVHTAAGRRWVEYRPGPGPQQGFATVQMGTAVLGDQLELDEPPGLQLARGVNMGNPHLVLLLDGPVHDAVVSGTGPRLERSVTGGANVEFVWRMSVDEPVLGMRVWERGVGETLACGTGSCAAAAAAASWGLGGRHFTVHNPGGPLEVELTDDGMLLGGPTQLVARVEVGEDVLAAAALSPADVQATAVCAGAQGDEVAAGR